MPTSNGKLCAPAGSNPGAHASGSAHGALSADPAPAEPHLFATSNVVVWALPLVYRGQALEMQRGYRESWPGLRWGWDCGVVKGRGGPLWRACCMGPRRAAALAATRPTPAGS